MREFRSIVAQRKASIGVDSAWTQDAAWLEISSDNDHLKLFLDWNAVAELGRYLISLAEQETYMTNPNKQAFPLSVAGSPAGYYYGPDGMTLREYYAGLALSAMVHDIGSGRAFELVAGECVDYADALIAALQES